MDIYRNLSNGKWSLRERGLVIGHADGVVVSDPEFVVSEAGRERVLRERRKNVHAYVRGEVRAVSGFVPYKGRGEDVAKLGVGEVKSLTVRVNYNPYKAATFVTGVGPIHSARRAALNGRGLTASI